VTAPPRVYVAGPSSDLDRARAVMRELERRGAVVQHDWVSQIDAAGGRLPDCARARREAAEADLRGVDAADVVLGLLGPPSVGRCHELGAALLRVVRGEPVRVVTCGPRPAPDIWDELCEHLGDDRDAARALTRGLRSAPSVADAAEDLALDALRREVLWSGRDDAARLARDARELLARPRSPAEARGVGAALWICEALRDMDGPVPRGALREALYARVEALSALDEEDHLLALARPSQSSTSS
jgi:hypothetical protein